jgi:undecaprenyl phosphate N,N'-diacetylbacillosamine 1-phosphate transferase
MTTPQEIVKRSIDIVVSALLLILTIPFLCLIALMIRAGSSGPAIFRQKRVGKNGQPFTMFKLRTMYLDVPDIRNSDSTTFNSADDPRVTPLGRFLRMTSCDELPQLFNVLLGTMSLVGPRPELPAPPHRRNTDEIARLKVLPGITGLAVIQGRNEVPLDHRRALDAEYVNSQSLLLDFKVLMMTAIIALRAKGVNQPNDNRLSGFYLDAS